MAIKLKTMPNCIRGKQMTLPLVSICIPNYNYERYIGNCIESVISQTYSNIEIVVTDNCSNDNSVPVAKSYADHVRVYQNKENIGMIRNFNAAFDHANGEYVVFLSSDDVLGHEFIDKTVSIMENYPNVGFVITANDEIDHYGNIQKVAPFYHCNCIVPKEIQLPVFAMTGIGFPSQILIRSDIFRKIGGYDLRYSHFFDWHLNFKCALYSDMGYVAEKLMLYRRHNEHSTWNSIKTMKQSFEYYLMLDDIFALSEQFNQYRVLARREEAFNRIGDMSLKYAMLILNNANYQNGDLDIVKKYLKLAQVFNLKITESDIFQLLQSNVYCDEFRIADFRRSIIEKGLSSIVRSKSFEPPEGYIKV